VPTFCLLPRQSLSLGSLATASRRQRPQPVADLAYNPEDIKARLSAVNVYTVANKKNEFVLVSGEVSRAPFARIKSGRRTRMMPNAAPPWSCTQARLLGTEGPSSP